MLLDYLFVLFFYFILNVKGAIINDTNKRWGNPIFFHIGRNVHPWYVNMALLAIQQHTCIKFELKSEAEIKNKNGLKFIWATTCGSGGVGRQIGSYPNQILLGPECYTDIIKIQRYIFFALGMYSEHTRIDRDTFVDVYPENAFSDSRTYFELNNAKTTTTFNSEYDFASIMHYNAFAFARNSKNKTIVPKKHDKYYEKMMGQKTMVAFNDYKLINFLYCSNTCKNTSVSCWRDGYEDPNNCGKCKCPFPFSGNICDGLIANDDSYCYGNHFSVTKEEYALAYGGFRSCYAYLDAPKDKLISLEIILNFKNTNPCIRGDNVLEIKYREDKSVMGLCFCEKVEKYKFISESHLVVVIYKGYYAGDKATVIYSLAERQMKYRRRAIRSHK